MPPGSEPAPGVEVVADLLADAPVPPRGIHSQTVSAAGGVDLILFAFAPGERLSEHTAAHPAILHVLDGEADIVVDGRAVAAGPGTWVRMPARAPHAVTARTGLRMALYLLPPSD
jgi:quercetin dioxygenase-like cupin family protein